MTGKLMIDHPLKEARIGFYAEYSGASGKPKTKKEELLLVGACCTKVAP